jgi:tellurite resistance protein
MAQFIPVGDFTWTAAGAWTAAVTLIGMVVRQVGPWRKQSLDAEKGFRSDLIARVQRLEDTLETERTKREAERESLRARHQAERAFDRHKIRSLQACFDALLMMLKADPHKVASVIEHIERLRADQLKAEALESGAFHAANLSGDGDFQ